MEIFWFLNEYKANTQKKNKTAANSYLPGRETKFV